MVTDTDLFPSFIEDAHRQRIADHLSSMRRCRPEWDGPKAGLYCSVHTPIVHNVTHGESRYHYMAPCQLIKQDGKGWLARIEYSSGHCADLYNGEILRLELTDIWPPSLSR